MNRRGSVVATVSCGLILAMAGCAGGGHQGGKPTPTRTRSAPAALHDAIAAVKKDSTGQYSIRSEHHYPDFGTDGRYDLGLHEQEMDLSSVTYEDEDDDEGDYFVVRRRVVGDHMFVQYEDIGQTATCWVDLSGDKYFDPSGARDVAPITFLDSLRAVSIAKNGIDLQATAPLGRLKEIMFGTFGPESATGPAALVLEKPADHRVPVHVRIRDGHVESVAIDLKNVVADLKTAKIDVRKEFENPEYLEKYLISVTILYFDFGKPVDLEQPDADEIGLDFDQKCAD